MKGCEIGLRLKEERRRLGMSQSAFGALAGVAKGAVIKWEKGATSPNATALAAFAKAGADVIYIVTGRAPSYCDLAASDAVLGADILLGLRSGDPVGILFGAANLAAIAWRQPRTPTEDYALEQARTAALQFLAVIRAENP